MNQTRKTARLTAQVNKSSSLPTNNGTEKNFGMPLVKLRHYCMLTGDTPQAVHSRRKRGEWVDGRHCFMKAGRRLWIDLNEVGAWIRASH